MFLLLAALIAVSAIAATSVGQYWFQTGADSDKSAAFNNGASVYIQTIKPQSVQAGAFGFWVGETLSNGAFVQVGYEIPNASGYYPASCSPSSCNGSTYLYAGKPTWFWEYFPSGYTGSGFYGGIGQNDAVGENGTFNRYWFAANGSVWNFYFNNQKVGTVSLGVTDSGSYSPSAYGEIADTNNNNAFLSPVLFKNLSYLSDGTFKLIPAGYSYVGYGVGSEKTLPNVYGVQEVEGRADFFQVGSGVTLPQNGTSLWTSAYHLAIVSQYGNSTGSGYYTTFSKVNISTPQYVYITPQEREVFTGWAGSGPGSYSGPLAFSSVNMQGNITEAATWKTEYYLTAFTPFGSASGGGWYPANATADVSLNSTYLNVSQGVREVFQGWSNGATDRNTSVVMRAPGNISARWQLQYFVGLSSQYGSTAGSGWYDNGSKATISLSEDYFNSSSSTRIAFYSWSGLYNSSNTSFAVLSPVSLVAQFKRQYLVTLVAQDSAFNRISVPYFTVNGRKINGSVMLFAGVPYNVTGTYYKGVEVPLNRTVSIAGAGNITIALPVYTVTITSVSILKKPVNATVHATFANGTSSVYKTGQLGTLVLQDVPFGKVTGYAAYGPLVESLSASDGSNPTLTFLNPDIIFMMVGVIIVLIVYEVLARRYHRKTERKAG